MTIMATLLAVDETPELLARLRDILTPAGYTVHLADSDTQALGAMTAGAPDLILLGIRMSGIGSLELFRRFRANEAWRRIPVILMSAPEESAGTVAGLALGAADYVSRLCSAEELLSRVQIRLAVSRERTRVEGNEPRFGVQVHHSQKMESVGRLAGGVAHEFNNMLGVILANTEFALEGVDKTQQLYTDLQEIKKAALRSADLTQRLLVFATKQIVVPKVLNLNDAVASMLKMLQRLIGENIRLDWQPTEDIWPVKIDPSQIDQILANLCVNARDAIRKVGTITITTGCRQLTDGETAGHTADVRDYVMLEVSDDGCGMNAETVAHLFEPFFTTKDIGKGTGLGLSVVYGIVTQNHGFVEVESTPNEGTTFRIYLPRDLSPNDADAPRQDAATAVARGNETILIVEDEPSLLNAAAMALEMQGYQVISASTPTDAIRMAEAHTGDIRLLLTDVVMPEMNGRSLSVYLRSRQPSLRTLFMSAYSADVIADNGVLPDGVHLLRKPFSIVDLAARVREVIDAEEVTP